MVVPGASPPFAEKRQRRADFEFGKHSSKKKMIRNNTSITVRNVMRPVPSISSGDASAKSQKEIESSLREALYCRTHAAMARGGDWVKT